MDKLPGYDNWKSVNPTNSYDVVPPQLESTCIKCGQYILNMDGTPTDSWDCSVELDLDWGRGEQIWTYWHDNCQQGDVA